MTANDSESGREACRAAGMDGYISNPVRVNILNGFLTKYLDNGVSDADQVILVNKR